MKRTDISKRMERKKRGQISAGVPGKMDTLQQKVRGRGILAAADVFEIGPGDVRSSARL